MAAKKTAKKKASKKAAGNKASKGSKGARKALGGFGDAFRSFGSKGEPRGRVTR